MSATDSTLAQPSAPSARTFFGEPRAIGYLAFTEVWERFSFYGMAALLVLYMTHSLLLPGHVEHIAGFAGFRRALESVFGPMSNLALASQIYGLYTGFVYFTPVFGGWIADRWIGQRGAVVLGAVLMSAGQISMAFDESFLLALLLLVVGSGLLKGNISTQVGSFYADDDSAGRTRGYSIFSMGINVGAVAGPLLCALLAQLYGWHAGFGLAGALMLVGLVTYLIGYRTLSTSRRATPRPVVAHALTRSEWRIVGALAIVTLITVFQSVSYYQNTDLGLVWIEKYVDLGLLGFFHVPASWFGGSIDSLASVVFVPVLIAIWRYQDARGGEPGEVAKIATGAAMACCANLLLVAASTLGHGRVSVLVPIVYDVLLGVAFLYYWPPLLALVSRAAPPSVRATLMGAAFLSLFLANITLGWIGGFYEHMTPARFWALHAAIAGAGAVLAFALKKPLGRVIPAA
jgi:proton-dependent oligopeptide transporter, POT family